MNGAARAPDCPVAPVSPNGSSYRRALGALKCPPAMTGLAPVLTVVGIAGAFVLAAALQGGLTVDAAAVELAVTAQPDAADAAAAVASLRSVLYGKARTTSEISRLSYTR